VVLLGRPEVEDLRDVDQQAGNVMTTIDGPAVARRSFFHDPDAPPATVVVPSAFCAARDTAGRLLLVRRCDSGTWELPGGQVDVGETAVRAAVRETLEESGVSVMVTGMVGLFTDPGHVVRARIGTVRQQFVVVFSARPTAGTPRGDAHETSDAAWVDIADLPRLAIESPIRGWIASALSEDVLPQLA
jgi:ADP-ribose pyrophosphatase YjhB (NUDIX family)